MKAKKQKAGAEVVKLSPPWVTHYNKVKALFAGDDDIIVEDWDGKSEKVCKFTIRVNNPDKFAALDFLLAKEVVFGNVTLRIVLVPANRKIAKAEPFTEANAHTAFDTLLGDTRYYTRTAHRRTPMGTYNYVMFAPTVVQFFNDDIGDLNQLFHGIPADLAREVFKFVSGVNFSTEKYCEDFED